MSDIHLVTSNTLCVKPDNICMRSTYIHTRARTYTHIDTHTRCQGTQTHTYTLNASKEQDIVTMKRTPFILKSSIQALIILIPCSNFILLNLTELHIACYLQSFTHIISIRIIVSCSIFDFIFFHVLNF